MASGAGGVDVAKAQLANILAGTRAETIAQRKAEDEAAEANFTLAQRTYDRIKELAGNGNAPLQRLDEVTNSLEVAKRQQDQAKLAYEEAVNGATKEERGIAETNVLKAQASVDTIKAQVDELVVKAPIASQVYQIGAELGEYVSPGVPLLSLIDLSDIWLRFNLREDLVRGPQGRRPVHDARARARRSGDHRGDQAYRDARRIRRLAGDPGDRRLRSEDLRGARLSRHAAAGSSAGHERLRRVAVGADGRAAMKPPARPGLLLVATRELRWMRRDEVALMLSIIVPVIAFAVLTLTFSNAVIRNLRVTIVDADRSATSLTYIQALGSSPGVSVAERSGDMTSAMRAIRSGEAIAAVYIPENFERDLLARQRPQIVTLYNRQYFTPGNNANSSISNAIAAATATLPRGGDGGGYRPGALVSEQYVLSNPALNYAQFLLRAILPTVLHVVVALAAGYAVGSEFSRRSKRAWLRTAGGRPLVALVGKLLPLFGLFVIMEVDRRRHSARVVRRLVSRRSRSWSRRPQSCIFSAISGSGRCWFC